ncbi:hypothetical protein [Sinomicrobium soli]|uniref:hypothetical protein n=1 Tax=Sinomicrobium sp. N-1-3-6 TaxID=2219864 RepID=UPI000DCD7502|nr:hypothetical protein [Sinomicrobium sp. N-1-3-6]RAV28292.1 hypothetical protein DN748_14120 [Sinomicrobium sp. N-1-3-6]
MKKVSIAAVLLTFVVAVSGCLSDDGANFYDEAIPTVSIDSVPDSLEVGEDYKIAFSYRIPTECHTYIGNQGWTDTEASTDSIRVVTFVPLARVQTSSNDSCRTVNIVKDDGITNSFQIDPTAATLPYLYKFQFWTGKDSNGDDEFISRLVPVKREE